MSFQVKKFICSPDILIDYGELIQDCVVKGNLFIVSIRAIYIY